MAMIRPEIDMKDSGIEWVGVIPKEWSSIKGKYVYFVQAGYPFNSEHFSLIKGMPLIRIRDITSGKCETYFDGDYSDEYVVNNTDLLIGMDGDFNVRWWESGQAVLNQRCCRILEKNNISRKYLYYALPFSLKELNDLTYFTTVKHLSNNGILNLNFPFPPLSEQQAIADYLDETCSKIDEIIAEAKASIDEYKELKQAVIFEAVTKGLDKNVEFIDSGDEWLGKYPKSYSIGQLSMLSNIVRGGSPRPAGDPRYYGGNIPFMRISDITKDDNIYVNSCENTITEEGLTRTRMIPSNTLLLTNSGATLGVPKINTFETTFNDGIAAFLDLDKRLNIIYVYFFLKARTSYFLEYASMGMGQPNLNTDIIGRTKIVFPTLAEQQKIVLYLKDRCKKLNSLIVEKESLINDLEAYKKSLIYEVVTGKRRVV